MNTFFRTCLFLCIGLIIFTLGLNFVNGLGVFPTEIEAGVGSGSDTSSYFSAFAEKDTSYIWGLVIGGGVIAGGLISVLTRSIVPVGISIYATVFWTSYLRALGVLNIGNYIPADFLLMFTVGIVFLFIGSIVGMLTGSG